MNNIKVKNEVFKKLVIEDDLVLPYTIDENKEWYPMSYLSVKILKRKNKNSFMPKDHRSNYPEHVKMKTIFFGEDNIQDTWCVDRELMIERLKTTKLARLTTEAVEYQNKLHILLGIDLLPVKFDDDVSYKKVELKFEEYIEEIFKFELNDNPDMLVRQCSNCKRVLPLTNTFYPPHNGKQFRNGYNYTCKECIGKVESFSNKGLIKIKELSITNKILAKNDPVEVYKLLMKDKINSLPEEHINKESYKKILKYISKIKTIDKNLDLNGFSVDSKLVRLRTIMSDYEIFSIFFGEDFLLSKDEYPNLNENKLKLDYNDGRKLINKYILDNDIVIINIFTYKYYDLLKKTKLAHHFGDNTLKFVVEYYNKLFPGYYFKIASKNYYKERKYILLDLKHLIEKDMKIKQIEKIPLYLTRMYLQRNCRPLYNWIITKKNGSLFEYVNDLYPDTFEELDFEVKHHRNNFDSDEEAIIDEKLRSLFKNVIYNQRNTDNSIEIAGSYPDWIIIDDKGLIVVEHLGMYRPDIYDSNSRIKVYVDKAEKKLAKYRELNHFRYIFFYPEDVANNYKGVDETIRKFKENPELSMI